jgi:hypothetical protein
MMRRPARALRLVALASAAAAVAAPAQGPQVRFGGSTVAQVIELPTLTLDSIPVGSTTGTGSYRQTPDGYVAWCQPGFAYCLYHRSGPTVTTAPITQDLEANAWGFGEGLRFYGQIRLRTTANSQAWPLADQHVALLAAFLEYDRDELRARLGRQFIQGGLGYYNYDGLSVLWRAKPWLDAQVYGGSALLEGLNEPYTTSLVTGVTDPTMPNSNAWLIGGQVRARSRDGSSISALFQLVDRTDNLGYYSERLAVNGLLHAGISTITGDLQADFATGAINLGQIRAQLPVTRNAGVMAEFRHYSPFFELWNFWSVFSPVGYNEGNVGGYWNTTDGALALQLSGGYRTYENTNAGFSGSGSLRTSGWRAGADVTWKMAGAWMLRGGYHYDIGPGAAESDGSGTVRWEPNDQVYVGLFASAFQTAYEYEQGFGTVLGGGATAGARVSSWGRLAADVGEYRNTYGGNAPQSNWNQFRASLRFEFTVGAEPELTGVVR